MPPTGRPAGLDRRSPGVLPTVAAAPPAYRFSGHQTFPFRYDWLPKAAEAAQTDPWLFTRSEALARLGVGKNMVSSIRHWCEATGLMEIAPARKGGHARMTPLGELIFGVAPPNLEAYPPPPKSPGLHAHQYLRGAESAPEPREGLDPFLEDPGTLWTLHWRLTAPPAPASTWRLVFTVYSDSTFTREELAQWLLGQARAAAGARRPPSLASIRRDVEVFLRTYLPPRRDRRRPAEDGFDCPLAELGLIRPLDATRPGTAAHRRYAMPRGPRRSLPDAVLAYAIHEFWNESAAGQETLTLERLLFHPGSPGAAFRLDDRSLVAVLERFPKALGLRYDETAGLRQLRRLEAPPPLSLLERRYRDR